MPTNKKKKKPVSNPARGFATVSTASKAKPLEVDLSVDAKSETVSEDTVVSQDPGGAFTSLAAPNKEKSLQELSPEDLEKQLEESALQGFLDIHGQRVAKDVSRHVSRLKTERRLVRNQAMALTTFRWLPEKIVQMALQHLSTQRDSNSSLENISELRNTEEAVSGDDLLIKIWTLRQILLRLGFSVQKTLDAICHLLTVQGALDQKSFSVSKDSVWGLDECMSWLALTSDEEDLLSFRAFDHQETSMRSRPPKPSLASEEGETQFQPESTSPPPTSSRESPVTFSSPDESNLPSFETDTDSDLEPEQLVEKHLDLQKRLYEISPASYETNRKGQRGPKKTPSNSKPPSDQVINRKIDRLAARISKIEKDILFDQDEADRRWAEMQINLAKEAAERRRLRIRPELHSAQQAKGAKEGRDTNQAKIIDEDEDNADMLGNMFNNDRQPAEDHTTDGAKSSEGQNDIVTVRDFGKWTGMSPRRIFEEACKSRDSSARITYSTVSGSSLSKRHSLTVDWNRECETTISLPFDSLLSENGPYNFRIQMLSTACPDSTQSEAYISTVALFLIFASKPEQKVHMRLPSVWRDLWDEISNVYKEQQDAKDRDVLRELQRMIEENESRDYEMATNAGTAELSSSSTVQRAETMEPEHALTQAGDSPVEVQAIWKAKEQTLSYQRMLQTRMSLPVYAFKEDLLHAIDDHQVVIVCGETGCGKSTQVPAYILEHQLSSGRSCKIYCTEPRRISAISLARRVSEELGEKKGELGTSRSLVGYAIRLESRISTQTRLVYATTGIVMRMLEGAGELREITHLVLDEGRQFMDNFEVRTWLIGPVRPVHERSIDSDFLLIVLRKLLLRRPELKVILMSATVNAEKFSSYLNHTPILKVPGRTFPVETKYLEDAIQETHFNPVTTTSGKDQEDDDDDDDEDIDRTTNSSEKHLGNLAHYSTETTKALTKYDEYRINYDLINKLLIMIFTNESYRPYSKAILVFLPGIAEIRRLNNVLANHASFRENCKIHSLHSTIPIEEQERAFQVPPEGTRKIVLATNIAETGITIPDVTCVIDTGKHREMRFDERRQLSRLIEVFISRANAKQRRGRAGRVQKGLCFHLFTKERHDKVIPEEQTPEMLRLSLQDLVLRVKICKLGSVDQTLMDALDPPSSKNIRRAIDSLIDVKALTASEDLTPLGRRLARLPLDVFLGKILLVGAIFGCLDAMMIVAAILSSKSPFSATMGEKSRMDAARLAFKKADSDLLTVYNAYCAWRRVCCSNGMSEYEFCRKNFLSQQTLSNIEDLKTQLATSLADAGVISFKTSENADSHLNQSYGKRRRFVELPDRYNKNNDNELILNSVIAWSFYPKLLRREGKGWRNVANNQTVSLHPTSVNKGRDCSAQWLSYYHIMQSSNKFYNAHETSSVEDFAIALVCGEAEFKLYSGVVVIDGNRIRYSVDDWKTLLVLKSLRIQLQQIMAQSFRNPERALTQQQQNWFDIWEKIFTLQGKAKS